MNYPPPPALPDGVDFQHLDSIPEFAVSSDGRAWTLRPPRSAPQGWSGWRVLHVTINRDGYHLVGVFIDGKWKTRSLYRLVLEGFVGPCPDGMECLHGPNGKDDNSVSNVRWGTRAENMRDCVRSGTNARKLTREQVAELRAKASAGADYGTLATEYGVSRNYVGQVARGEYRHPDNDPDKSTGQPTRKRSKRGTGRLRERLRAEKRLAKLQHSIGPVASRMHQPEGGA